MRADLFEKVNFWPRLKGDEGVRHVQSVPERRTSVFVVGRCRGQPEANLAREV